MTLENDFSFIMPSQNKAHILSGGRRVGVEWRMQENIHNIMFQIQDVLGFSTESEDFENVFLTTLFSVEKLVTEYFQRALLFPPSGWQSE